MQTVGNAPAATIRSMPSHGRLDRLEAGDDLAGDAAASELPRRVLHRLEEPLLADRRGLARADALEPLRVLELVAEGEVVRARLDQRVVLGEHAARHRVRLDADEPSDLLADRPHEGLALPQAVDRLEPIDLLEVIARVQVREDRARLVARGAGDLDDVLDSLAGLLADADVLSGRAELAGLVARPVEAGVGHVDAEIVALENADAGHRDAGRRRPPVPGGLLRKSDAVRVLRPSVEDDVARRSLHELERRPLGELLDDRHVDPDRLARARNHQLQARTEARARPSDPPARLHRRSSSNPAASRGRTTRSRARRVTASPER